MYKIFAFSFQIVH